MGLPEYAHGFRADVPLEPDDLFPVGGGPSPLDVMDAAQEGSIFASAFTAREPRGLVRTQSPYDEAGDYTDAAIFRDAFK